MKKLLYITSTILLLSACTQKTDYEALYKQAKKSDDAVTAIVALNGLVAEGQSLYSDTLAALYLNANMPQQCLNVVKPLLAEKETKKRLELAAFANKGIGDAIVAIDYFQKRIGLGVKKEHLYELAYLQFRLKRQAELEQTLTIFASQPADTLNTEVYLDAGELSQIVPVDVGMQHLTALLYVDRKQNEEAIAIYAALVEKYPNFKLAQQNLKALQALPVGDEEKG